MLGVETQVYAKRMQTLRELIARSAARADVDFVVQGDGCGVGSLGHHPVMGAAGEHLERDEWKIIHEHWSFGASEEIYGEAPGYTFELISERALFES